MSLGHCFRRGVLRGDLLPECTPWKAWAHPNISSKERSDSTQGSECMQGAGERRSVVVGLLHGQPLVLWQNCQGHTPLAREV